MFTKTLPPSLLQRNTRLCTRVTVHWEKGSKHSDVEKYYSELMLTHKDKKVYPCQTRVLWRSGDSWSLGFSPSHSRSTATVHPFCGYFLLHIGSVINGVRAIIVRSQIHCSLPVSPSPSLTSFKAILHPSLDVAENNTIIKDMKGAEGSIIFSFYSPIWLIQKTDVCSGMPMHYHKLNQVVTAIAAAISNVVSPLEQIITTLGTFYAVIDPANIFFSITSNREN